MQIRHARATYTHTELRRLLHPASIAIVGASTRAGSFGQRSLANLSGYRGEIHLVNERYAEVEGRACHASIARLPEVPDCVISAVPVDAVREVVRDCIAAGVGGVVVYASGFSETALPERVRQQRELEAMVAGTGTRLLGPNCAGTYNLLNEAHLTFGRTVGVALRAGQRPTIGIVSQSGALGMSLSQSMRHGVAISHMLSPGNAADVGVGDLVAYLAGEPDCDAIVCIFEGIDDPRHLVEAAHIAKAAGKPLVVYKTGRSESGADAALSHTGSVAGTYSAWSALFERAGAVVVDDLEAMIETASFFAKAGRPSGDGVIVVTTSGGAGVIAADMADRFDVALPQPSTETIALLRTHLPEFAAMRNPCDITAQVLNDDKPMRASALALLSDPRYDAAVVPHLIADSIGLERVRLWGEVATQADKVACYVWCSEWLEGPGADEVEALPRVALFRSAARCFQALQAWYRREAQLAYAQLDDRVDVDPHVVRRVASMLADAAPDDRGERFSKEIVAAYGIPIVRERLLGSRADCADFAMTTRGAVALKLESRDVPHKTDAGVVHLNLVGPGPVLDAYDRIIETASKLPNVRIEGVVAQTMIEPGVELMIGARFDPQLGPLLVVGAGGIDVEILDDVQAAAAPLGRAQALAMLQKLRCYPMLRGHRGRAPVPLDAVVDAMCRLGELTANHGGPIAEIDINPLICSGNGVVAVDALIVYAAPGNLEEPA
jgi:acyl-CoA synthetase (NDP forming)